MSEVAGLSIGTICRGVGDGWSLVTRASANGFSLLLPGGSLGCGGEPFAPMNWAYIHGPDKVAETVRRFAELLAERGLPGTLSIAGDAREEGDAAAVALGLAPEPKPSPLMVAELGAAPVEGGRFVVRPVADAATLAATGLVLADAYDCPLEHIVNMMGGRVPDAVAVSWFVGFAGDEPASVCAVALSGPIAGVYAVGTAHAHRRQGAARATIGVALADCATRGARVAGLLSDSAAIPLYESLGFRTIDQPSEWQAPGA